MLCREGDGGGALSRRRARITIIIRAQGEDGAPHGLRFSIKIKENAHGDDNGRCAYSEKVVCDFLLVSLIFSVALK